MAFDFPASPTVGQVFPATASAGQPQYTWDGEKWTSGTGFGTIYVSDAQPANAPAGSLWWQSSTGFLFVRYYDGNSTQWVSAMPASVPVVQGYISGLTLSTPGSSASMTVAPGVAADSTNVAMMVLASALTKVITSNWSVGNGGGILDTGAAAASMFYHIFLIKRPDTGAVDVLASLSLSPVLPPNYTLFRRIGSLLTGSSVNWAGFVQLGDEFMYTSSVSDVNVSNLSTGAQLYALTVPIGIQVWAMIRASVSNATAGVAIVISSPDANAEAPGSPLGNVTQNCINSTTSNRMTMNVRTNTAGQIRAVATANATTFSAATFGYIDRRGRDGNA